MSRWGEIVAFNAKAPTTITTPRIFAPRDKGLPFNSIRILRTKMAGRKVKELMKETLSPRRV
jgi:hypothetical protein